MLPAIENKGARIIKRIPGGETELYEILVRRNNQKLYHVIRAYIKNEEEIEDAIFCQTFYFG